MKTFDLKTPETRECPSPAADSFHVLQTNFTTDHEYALSLECTAEALATENRRLGYQLDLLASENRRLRGAAEQMRAELLVFNKLLEPLHAVAEQMDQQQLGCLSNQMLAVKARLASLHSSRSWRITAPLRWCDDIQRRLVRWLCKRLGSDD